MKNKILYILLIVSFVSSFVGCRKSESDASKVEEEVLAEDIVELRDDQIKLAGVVLGTIDKRSLSGSLKVTGTVTVAPGNLATVTMPFGGYVRQVSLTPGSRVSKGQVLATIENKEFVDLQQNYLGAKNKLQFLSEEYQRHKQLYKEDVYSQKNMQQVEMEYKNQRAELRALEQKLSLIGVDVSRLNEDNITRSVRLLAPIGGYLRSVNVSIGKSVLESDVLFEIVNTNNMLLELNVFEKDADKISTGSNVRFFLNNETEEHKARIYQTAKSVGDDKRLHFYANVLDHCTNIYPGMYVNASVDSGRRQALTVPSESIVSYNDKDFIFVYQAEKVENGNRMTEYKMIEVTRGVSEDGITELILPANLDYAKMKIVLKGAYNLLSAKENAGAMSCG